MPTKASAARPSARERLLAAADDLFYREGVQSVGVDRVVQQAGVAKASLYSLFGSKEELVQAYLDARHASTREQIGRVLTRFRTPRERLLGVFDAQGQLFTEPDFNGCAHMTASAAARPGGPV
jgi:AcrR family transcriptional regulator